MIAMPIAIFIVIFQSGKSHFACVIVKEWMDQADHSSTRTSSQSLAGEIMVAAIGSEMTGVGILN